MTREAGTFDPRAIFAALSEAGVEYVTVGAFAVIAHGVVRATADVDIVPAPTDQNRQRLAAALGALAGHPGGEPGTPVDAALLARDANMRFQTRVGQLGVLAARRYAELYPRLAAGAVHGDAEGLGIPVAGRDDLLMLKAGAGRARDLRDIGDLMRLEE